MESISKTTANNIDVGFHSIHLEAAHNITIKRGMSVKCNASFSVNDGVLYVYSENDGITLAVPQVALDKVEISSTYDSIKCEGLQCSSLNISSAHNVRIENSYINECEISSEYDSVRIVKSTITKLNISAAHNVDVELDDFCYVEIESEYDGVKVKYNGNQLVNVDCTSSNGSVKATGPFYGGADCDKQIVITAAHSIKLLGAKK